MEGKRLIYDTKTKNPILIHQNTSSNGTFYREHEFSGQFDFVKEASLLHLY